MEEEFKVIDNYLMVRMPAEVDHHASEYIGRTADRYILKEGVQLWDRDHHRTI